MNDDALRYPIGKYKPHPAAYTEEEIREAISRIAAVPSAIEEVTQHFSDKHFDTPYRPDGWTARQVLHHLPDSHMNAYVRFKWTLTENKPVIKAYDEKLWAETPEAKQDPRMSLNLLKALHIKWVALMESLTPEDLQKEYIHPETKRNIRLDQMIGLYAWHGNHHLGHLKIVAEKFS